jgi:hypothetical protein
MPIGKLAAERTAKGHHYRRKAHKRQREGRETKKEIRFCWCHLASPSALCTTRSHRLCPRCVQLRKVPGSPLFADSGRAIWLAHAHVHAPRIRAARSPRGIFIQGKIPLHDVLHTGRAGIPSQHTGERAEEGPHSSHTSFAHAATVMRPNTAVVRTGGKHHTLFSYCGSRRTLPRWAAL